MKILTTLGYCSNRKSKVGLQFKQEGSTCTLGGSFIPNASSPSSSASSEFTGSFLHSPNFGGCRLCGNKYVYVCTHCGTFICYDGKAHKNETCPACKKTADVPAVSGNRISASIKPAPPKKKFKIAVTHPCYDDIAQILDSLKIPYQDFDTVGYNCDILFLNCGTDDYVNATELRNFVSRGGCLYASDLTMSIVEAAFPNYISKANISTGTCKIWANVDDPELRGIVGNKIEIEFDLPSWAAIESVYGTVLLSGAQGSKFRGRPIMVKFTYGNGTVFYTSFHNYAQASEKEVALLQLLVLKQIASNDNSSIEEAGANMGVNVNAIKAKFSKGQ